MNGLDLLGGFACLAFGIFIILKQIKKFRNHQQDQLGFDIKLLGGGIIFIMGGICLIAQSL